jgi:hypothetical protein
MSGGAEKKKTNNMLDQQYAQNQQQQTQNSAEHNQFMDTVNSGLSGATGRANDMYNSLYGGYDKFANGGGNFDPSKYGSINSGGGGGGGGDPRFGDVESSYRNFMSGGGVDTGMFNRFQGNLADVGANGGWSQDRINSMDSNIQGMKGVASDPEIAARFRGNGVFDEFAKTGGYSDQDIANIRSRANSVIPAYYDVAKQAAGRTAAVQGGYGPGQSALMARMSRDQAKGAAGAALDAEVGIKDKVNSGRQWGAGQVSSAENALQGTRLNALTGASNAESGMVNSIAQNRIGASSAGGNNEIGMQGVIQQGKEFGTQGLEGMAESAAARGAAGAAAAAADAKWRAQFDREGQQYGLSGMQSLYGDRPGEVGMYLDANLQGRGLNNSNYNSNARTAGGTIDQRIQNNPQHSVLGTIGQVAGAAGGLMTGVGALGYGRPRRTGG